MTTVAAPRTHRQKEIRRHLLLYAGMTPFLFIAVFPIYWMAITAFKQEADLYRMGNIPFWFNLPPTLKNFETLFYQTNYGYWIVNTLTISAWVALITLLTAVPAGYALARLRLPGAENIGIATFITYLVPGLILFLPRRGWWSLGGDSWWALVVVYPTFTIPFCVAHDGLLQDRADGDGGGRARRRLWPARRSSRVIFQSAFRASSRR